MTAEAKLYTRLTRNAAGLGTYASLWLAGDHLLIVSSTGYSETYARIMLGDIKAFFVTPTGRRLWWGIAWGLVAAISGIRVLMLLAFGQQPTASVVFLAVAAVMLVLNWTRGAGCRVQVMTGVQNTVLPALTRTKKTRAVLARLQPLIAAAQADRTHRDPAPVAGIAATEPPPPTIPAPPLSPPAAVPPADAATPS